MTIRARSLIIIISIASLLISLIQPLQVTTGIVTNSTEDHTASIANFTRKISNIPDATDRSSHARFSRFAELDLEESVCQNGDFVEAIIGVKTSSKQEQEKIKELVTETGGRIAHSFIEEGKPQTIVANIPQRAFSAVKQQLLSEGVASYVELNMKLKTYAVPNDPEWSRNWGLGRIKADYHGTRQPAALP
ncbi:hypothetical protein KEJ15_07095 [Candidatus Bathyarchaeota archaeon]|nr:hypothetical protein [Candidatus Bathyarchaeota archaeon]